MVLPAMLAGYLFLLIFRPYEFWPILGTLRIERVYMLAFMAVAFLTPNKRFISSPVNYAVAGFCMALLVSGLGAYNGEAAYKLIENYLKFIIFYVMVILSVRNERDFRFILFAFIAIMGVYVGKSMWEFFLHDRYVYRMGIKRLVGVDITYGSPNAFAASICYSLPLLWALLRSQLGTKWLRRGLWAYGGMALVAILFTGSRSGMVTAILFFLLVLLGSSRKFIGIFVMLAGFVVSWDFMPDYLKERFLSTFGYGDVTGGAVESAEGRMEGFKQGMLLFKENPLIGFGPANFPFGWPGEEVGHNAHNIYGQLAGELGLAGILSFGSLLLIIYLTTRRIQKRFPKVMHALALQAAEDGIVQKERAHSSAAQSSVSKSSTLSRKYRMKGEPPASRKDDDTEPEHDRSREHSVSPKQREYALHDEAADGQRHAPRYRMKGQGQGEQALADDAATSEVAGNLRGTAATVTVSKDRRKKRKPLGAPLVAMQHLGLYPLVARAITQTIILMLFKGWADHNLYRYSWLWLAALTILTAHFFTQEVRRYARS
ncbi:O-antigen ligase family protein [Oleidesulfovibrio sp.]|uniref:O-antigen ligase family protein n=1 Tax=Oleidesulfovibrio sp. TaxID=2909707 RepID=UPI003A83AEB0